MDTQQPSSFPSCVEACAHELARHGVSALGPLYDLTAQRLVRYATALLHSQHDAEDATQTALVRVAMHPALLAHARCPWAYLLRMVRNESLMIARRRRRLRPTVLGELPEVIPDVPAKMDQQREIWKALRKLPPLQVEVVVLKIWEEMTFAQIARVLDKSPNTVASRYQYAIAKLTQLLQPMWHQVLDD